MSSTFTWLDFSERERRKALDVIDQFRDEDTRDELGIGTVRDALADLLFPGISTIQTRARYFLFIPWIYGNLEQRRIGYPDIRQRSRQAEVALIDTLANSGGELGVIGFLSRGRLQRLPSNVYWSGLRTWGILLFDRSQEEYHRWLNRYYARLDEAVQPDDGEALPPDGSGNWHPHLPDPPDDFPASANFELTLEEAEYLTDRIRQKVPGSLMAYFVEHGVGSEDAEFPWLHPAYAALPSRLREWLDQSQHFSEIMHGAVLVYNLLLAESRTETADLAEEYRGRLAEWWQDSVVVRSSALTADRDRFWGVVHAAEGHLIPTRTQTFVDQWHQVVLNAADVSALVDGRPARDLVRERERSIKRARARIGNEKMLAGWRGHSGDRRLNYRWRQAADIIDDIVTAQQGD
jgi:hypothetical protein